jgi:hypothetical protein
LFIGVIFVVVELPAYIGSGSKYVGAKRIRVGPINRYGTIPRFLDKEDVSL